MPAIETISADHDVTAMEDDPRWALVQRILASRNFSKSGRLSAFLIYICRCALENRDDEITEQQIGIHVFNRPADYNPGDDNIVRTTARQLRQRLALYYQEEGGADDIRIEVPKGGYHPSFVHLTEETSLHREPPVVDSGSAHARPSVQIPPPLPIEAALSNAPSRRWSSLAVVLAAVCGACLVLLGQRLLHRFAARPAATAPLWSTVFITGQPTVFVSGDAGLNMYNNLARTQVKLGDYASGAYLSTPAAQAPDGYTWASLASRRYVSFVDLTFADQMRQIEAAHGAQYSIKFARDVHPEDFRNANVILVGAPTYNPWDEMFDNRLNFHLHYDGTRNIVSVLNAKPESGEPSEYLPAAEDSSHRGYTHGFGYIAVTTNLEGNGRVMLVEGSTVAGVDASLSFLMNDAKMAPILKKASSFKGDRSNFEILLGANFLKSSSPDAQVLATRFYPSR
jgi:hypothetical protein